MRKQARRRGLGQGAGLISNPGKSGANAPRPEPGQFCPMPQVLGSDARVLAGAYEGSRFLSGPVRGRQPTDSERSIPHPDPRKRRDRSRHVAGLHEPSA